MYLRRPVRMPFRSRKIEKMKIEVKILTQPIEPTNHEMICVPRAQYAFVDLALKMSNGNIAFATIELDDGTHENKKQQFEAMVDFGKKIAEAWNEKYHPKK